MLKIQTVERPTGGVSDLACAATQPQSAAQVWVNLMPSDGSSLQAMQTQYTLPSEVMSYFPLHYQWAQLIHAGPALFLVTFLTAPSERYLFTPHELKMCVTPTRIVTVYHTPGQLQPALPLSPDQTTGGIGRVLCNVLARSVQSYEPIVQDVQQCYHFGFDKKAKTDQARWDKRKKRFLSFLRDEQKFLQHLAQESGQLCTHSERLQLQSLAHRVQGLARATWEAKG